MEQRQLALHMEKDALVQSIKIADNMEIGKLMFSPYFMAQILQ
jgi:hypothetical protein